MKRLLLLILSALFLVSCLTLKVLATRATWATLDRSSVTDAAANMFEMNGFVIVSRSRFDVYEKIVAFSPTCGITVASLAEEGHERRLFEAMAKPGERIFYVFNGTVRADFPLIESIAQKYLDRLLRGVGIASNLHPLYAGIAAQGCEVEKLGWKSLTKLPWRFVNKQKSGIGGATPE